MNIPQRYGGHGGHDALPVPRWQQRIATSKAIKRQLARFPGLVGAPPQMPTVGDCLGLCLPVDFPDVPGAIPRKEIEAFCNQPGYRGFGNNGSVSDYYLDNSLGKLRYRTLVAPYYRARRPRRYYIDEAIPLGERSAELLREAVEYHRDHRFKFSDLTVDTLKDIRATNLLYAGPLVNTPGRGLSPHSSTIVGGLMTGGGRSVADYQIAPMGKALKLGVYCHENAHMLCDFPDLYQRGNLRAGCGAYCLMSHGAVIDELNPPQLAAYLKYKAGWSSPQMIASGEVVTATADENRVFMLRKNATEYFLIEYRRRAGRDAALPDQGLAVWHVDELGSNTSPHATPAGHPHYECVLAQADGRRDLAGGEGDESTLFGPSDEPLFTAQSATSNRWWDGTDSGFQISRIRPVAGGLQFAVA